MNAITGDTWYEANQRYLAAALAAVRAVLKRNAAGGHDLREAEEVEGPGSALGQIGDSMPGQPALETLCATFGLSPFERDLLLLCAGMEMDSTFAALCGSAQGDTRRAYPTFDLALASLSDAHWSALTPTAPLRYWRLVEVGTGDALTTSPLRIDERVLHYLAGIDHPDERLRGLVEPLDPQTSGLPASQRSVVQQLVRLWSRTEGALDGTAIQLCGDEE